MKMSVYDDANLKYKYLLFNWREILLNPVILKFIVSIIIIVIIFKFDLVEIFNEVIGIDDNVVKSINTGIRSLVILFLVLKGVIPSVSKFIDTIVNIKTELIPKTEREVKDRQTYEIIVKKHLDNIINVAKKYDYNFICCVEELDRCDNNTIIQFLKLMQWLEKFKEIKFIYTIDTVKLSKIQELNNNFEKK